MDPFIARPEDAPQIPIQLLESPWAECTYSLACSHMHTHAQPDRYTHIHTQVMYMDKASLACHCTATRSPAFRVCDHTCCFACLRSGTRDPTHLYIDLS
jgi:hypothetical protein